MRRDFLINVQEFLANAFSVSIVRRMGPTGTLDCVRRFLKEIDLASLDIEPPRYAQELDTLTEALQQALPKGARNWGVARKCLNLFFRDAFYNFYLRRSFGLSRFENVLEIPLDSYVGRALRLEDDALPRWRTVKGLTPEVSERFQAVAQRVAKRERTHRVHLDVVYWRGERGRIAGAP